MTLSVWQRTIVNTAGDVLGSASVTVRRESDNALATLYDNPAGTGSPLTNPIIADSVGFVRFYTANDRYNITATSGSFSATWRHVQLGTAQSVDADQDLQTTDSVEFAALTVDDVTIDANAISTATGEDLTLSPAGDLIVSSNVNVTGDLTLSGDVTFTGSLEVDNLRLDGSTISSTTTGDNLTLSPLSGVAEVDGDLLPGADGTYDLGSPTVEWQNLYIDGIASIDSLVADTADINGGTIDNTIIGGSVAAAATFTSVDADYIDLATSTSPVPADAVGRLRWDQDEAGGTLMLGMSGGNVVQPVGEAQYYWVKASSAITKGQVIMASGVVGVSGKIEGAPATGLDKDTGIRVIGIASENIANNEWGLVTSFGYVRGVNTNAFNANDVLYLDPSVAGGLTNAMPAAPNAKVIVALVVVKDSTNGELLVRVSHGQTFGSFATDAQITSPSNNDFLVYDGTDNRWENYTAANARTAMGLGTIATQDANNVNIDGGSIDGTTIGASTRAAGNFTTLNANGNVTLGDASTDTVQIAGTVGLGSATASSSVMLDIASSSLTGTLQRAINASVTANSGATVLSGFRAAMSTEAASFTINSAVGFTVAPTTLGAGSSITNFYAFFIADQPATTVAIGINSLISSGSDRWNIYAGGTAANYFEGSVGIGKDDPSEKLEVNGNIKTSAPSGGTAAAWKLGTVASVSPTSPDRTIEVEIDGTTYYLHAKTTND